MKDLIARQLENEELAINLGIEQYMSRYRQAAEEGQASSLRPELQLLGRSVLAVSEALKKKVLETTKGAAMWHKVRQAVVEIGPDAAAFVALNELINISGPTSVAKVSVSIGTKILQNIDYLMFRKAMPQYVDNLMKALDSDHAKYKYGVMEHYMALKGVAKYSGFNNRDRGHLGAFVLFRVIEAVDLFEVLLVQGENGKPLRVVQQTPLTTQWLDTAHTQMAEMACQYLPMLIKPTKWGSMYTGGFLNCAGQYRIPAVRVHNRKARKELDRKSSMQGVYNTLNILQETPWRINNRVLEVMQECYANQLAGLPQDLKLLLEKPFWTTKEELKKIKVEQPERFKEWKIKRSHVYDAWNRSKSKRKSLHWQLWTAEKFKDDKEIFFVWTADWRGRLYPIQPHLNPQCNATGKSLLEFAYGVALGDQGADWLAMHGANEFGKDKLPMSERHQWVRDNQELILDSARNPLDGERFWMKAENPFMFLAFCFEWRGYVEQGQDYVSHLPVAVDGSCSGLQHYSALLRDPVGGAAVNLVPQIKPSDIYMQVAEHAKDFVAGDLDNEMASLWHGRIERWTAKRNTMTWAYSATLWGFSEQLVEEIQKKSSDFFGTGNQAVYRKAASYMAKVNLASIAKVVVKAVEGMNYLQEVAQTVAKSGHTLEWTAPSGMVVQHHYYTSETVNIETLHGKLRVRIALAADTDTPDPGKHKAAIAPNFIHSLDAAHLALTVRACATKGISSFAMIHDSFGCHAGNMETMARTLREAFIDMYSADILQDFERQLFNQLPPEVFAELPKRPEPGTLNLDSIRESLYFFA